MPTDEFLDETHRWSAATTQQIRRHVSVLKSRAAMWQPGPMPAEWGITNQPTRHPRRTP